MRVRGASFPSSHTTRLPSTFVDALLGVMSSYATVAATVIQQRAHAYYKPHASMQLAMSAALSLGVGLAVRLGAPLTVVVVLSLVTALSIAPLLSAGGSFTPPTESYQCPGFPYVPWLSMALTLGMMVQLPAAAWWRLLVVTSAVLVGYEWAHAALPAASLEPGDGLSKPLP